MDVRLSAILAMTLCCFAVGASAHNKTDLVNLRNGDRLTGEIESLALGRLSLATEALGTVSIEWKEVASIGSDYAYELRLTDGARYLGRIGPGANVGSVVVVGSFGTRTFDWQDIVEMRAVEDSLLDRIDVYLSANYSFTKASGVTQTELRANVSYEDEKSLNSLTSRATVSDTEEQATASSRVVLTRLDWSNREDWFRSVFAGYESNDELALDHRLSIGAGFGRYFWDSNSGYLSGSLALQALEERSVGGEDQSSVEAVISAGYARWRFDTPELDLRLDGSIYPSLTQSGRVRADGNATLRWELIRDFYWDLSLWGTYDNAAVDESAGQFDWGVTTGVGWSL